MSELKEHQFCECDECIRDYRGPLSNEMRPYYLKSEADKVIAELKKEIETQKRLRNMALASVPNVLKVMKIIQHQKYKRCVAMAMLCRSSACFYDTMRENNLYWAWKSDRTYKWHKRWRELAEQFKEAK